MTVLITGGAGFIGSALVRFILKDTNHQVIVVDKLTYASDLTALKFANENANFHFEQLDINDQSKISDLLTKFKPSLVFHLAAESHVDRSIDDPTPFIASNISGTFQLLEAVRKYWQKLDGEQREVFRFHHISTDEVYGDLQLNDPAFTESTSYAPSSPYSASKACSDHLVRAWYRTYGLPIVITNCSNNYGPYQFPEKLIPHMIISALKGKKLTVYGDGLQVRDWLFVDDHVKAIYLVALKGRVGDTYNIGGNSEKTNVEIVHCLCTLLENLAPQKPEGVDFYRDLITHVKDRPGHDLRYAVNSAKLENELHWQREVTFEEGLLTTVKWYLNNKSYWQNIIEQGYQLTRLGV